MDWGGGGVQQRKTPALVLAQFNSPVTAQMLQCELTWNRSHTEQALGVKRQDAAWPAPPQYLLIQFVKPLRAQPQILNTLSQALQTCHVPWPTHLAT